MKNYCIDWKPWNTTFQEQAITAELLPLNRGRFLFLLPLLDDYYESQRQIEEEAKKSKSDKVKAQAGIKSAIEMNKLLDKCTDILQNHVRNVRGFLINDKEPQIEQIMESTVFVPLLSEMLFVLVDISRVGAQELKNSEGQSTSEQ